ncbi:MAG TPA: hypothetical protein VHQ20_00415, partial [Patescibacteria group bacterium]|nr:hypothetical protein [Patescibacteria group bacterium]
MVTFFNKRKKHTGQNGFSTVEILIACAILVVVFSSVIMLVLGSQKMALDTQVSHEAQLLNSKSLEEGRNAAYLDFNSNQNFTGTTAIGGLTYSVTRTQKYISPCVKNITSRVDWTADKVAQYVTVSTQVTNPANVMLGGTECSTTAPPAGGWVGCYAYSSADLPSSNFDGYDVAVARISGHKYLFMVGHPSSPSNPEDLWIYNIDSTASPSYVNKLDVIGDGKTGLNAIAVVKNQSDGKYYAYMATDDNKNQFSVVDVSNPASLGAPVKLTVAGFGGSVKPTALEY